MYIRCYQLYLLLLVWSGLNLSACYYFPDLQAQTAGSAFGAFAGGAIASEITPELIALGTGITLGSVMGGIAGQLTDDFSPLRLEDPATAPAPMIYYTTLRAPLVPRCFYPAEILSTEDPPPVDNPLFLCKPLVKNG